MMAQEGPSDFSQTLIQLLGRNPVRIPLALLCVSSTIKHLSKECDTFLWNSAPAGHTVEDPSLF